MTITVSRLQSQALMLAWDTIHELGDRMPKIAGWEGGTYVGSRVTLEPRAARENERYADGYVYEAIPWSEWADRFVAACKARMPRPPQYLKLSRLTRPEQDLKYILELGIEAVDEINRSVEAVSA